MSRRLLTLLTTFAVVAGIAACSENIESGAACPLLCPQGAIELRDTVIDAVVVDSTLAGFPAIGFEETLLLANRGDTLETRVIVRFDSLPTDFVRPNAGSELITFVDSASIRLKLSYPLRDSVPFTLLAYDVDTVVAAGSAEDTTARTLAPLFRADRLLGSVLVNPAALADSTIVVPISSTRVLEKVSDTTRLRVGFAIQHGPSASVRLAGQGDASMLSLRFRVDPDTMIPAVVLLPRSRTPADAFTAAALADYQVVFRGTPPPSSTTLAVGGVPGRRVYLRFDLPRRIVDSTRVVRAALLITQAPNRESAVRTDTVTVFPDVIVATSDLSNLERAVRFTSRTFVTGNSVQSVPALRLVPADSGLRSIEMAALVATWTGVQREGVPRALVLRAENESAVGGTILFYSTEAAVALRPRLRLTYAPSLEFGLP